MFEFGREEWVKEELGVVWAPIMMVLVLIGIALAVVSW